MERIRKRNAKRDGSTNIKVSAAPPLLPANRRAWDIFRAQQSQVIVAAMGGIIGISHDSLRFKFEMYDIPRHEWREVFEQFQIIEAIYVESRNEAKGVTGGKDTSHQAEGQGRRNARNRAGDEEGR